MWWDNVLILTKVFIIQPSLWPFCFSSNLESLVLPAWDSDQKGSRDSAWIHKTDFWNFMAEKTTWERSQGSLWRRVILPTHSTQTCQSCRNPEGGGRRGTHWARPKSMGAENPLQSSSHWILPTLDSSPSIQSFVTSVFILLSFSPISYPLCPLLCFFSNLHTLLLSLLVYVFLHAHTHLSVF